MILSEDRRQCYQELQQALEQLQKTAAKDNLEPAALAIEYKKVQQFFGNQIMRAESDELDASETPPEAVLFDGNSQATAVIGDRCHVFASVAPASDSKGEANWGDRAA